MYTRLLIPVDGSKTAEAALPYGRTLARTLKIPVELLGIVDMTVLTTQVFRGGGHFETIVAESARSTDEYLKGIAKTFADHEVKCTVEKGKPEDVIIEKAGSDATLTAWPRTAVRDSIGCFWEVSRKRCCGAQSIRSYSFAPVKKPRAKGTQPYDL